MKLRTRAAIFVGALWLAALVCINVARAQDIYVRSTFKTVPNYVLQQQRPGFQVAADKLRRWWGGEPTTVLIGKAPKNSGAWQITVNGPTGLMSGYLGFHYFGPDGPYAIIKWNDQFATSVTITHEMEEMIVDPNPGKPVLAKGSRLWLVEVSDPVEATYFMAKGTPVSNFVGPAWYKPNSRGPYDYLHLTSRPEQLLYGGYVSYWTGTDWSSIANFGCGSRCFGVQAGG